MPTPAAVISAVVPAFVMGEGLHGDVEQTFTL
jgi:hypothetical protein